MAAPPEHSRHAGSSDVSGAYRPMSWLSVTGGAGSSWCRPRTQDARFSSHDGRPGPACPACGVFTPRAKGPATARPRDLPYGELELEFFWHRRRWWSPAVPPKSFTEQIPLIPAGKRLTARLRSTAGYRVRDTHTVVQTARDLHSSAPTVMKPAARRRARSPKLRCPRWLCWGSPRPAAAGPAGSRTPKRASGSWRGPGGTPDSSTHSATAGCSARSRTFSRRAAREQGAVTGPAAHHRRDPRPTPARHRPGVGQPDGACCATGRISPTSSSRRCGTRCWPRGRSARRC